MSDLNIEKLDQRILVFTRAFQDLLEEVMKREREKKELEHELMDIKRELVELRQNLKDKKKKK